MSKQLSKDPTRLKLQLAGFEIVQSILRSLVGNDEHPSPLIRTLQKQGKEQRAQVELAQDGVLLALDIMDVFHDAAIGKLSPWGVAGAVTTVVFSAIPELKNDVEAVKALEELSKAAEQEATSKESRKALDVIKRNMQRRSRP